MKNLYLLLLIGVFAFSALQGCSSSGTGDDDDDNDDVTSGITIVGAITGTSAGLVKTLTSSTKFAEYDDSVEDLCPATEDDAVNATAGVNTPSSYTVALKRLTLVTADNTEYEVFSADSVDDAYASDFSDDTTFFSSETYPTAGTYTGIEIELFYIEMEVPMIIPALGDTTATTYTTRGYFDDVGNVQIKDVTVFSEGTEYWINRDTNVAADAYELYAVTGTRPVNVLDLWADTNFWGDDDDMRDPLTICTEDVATDTCTGSALGTELTFNMEGESLTIPDAASGLYTITMTFDVTNRFTFWEYLENGLAADADGVFTVGFDCGYRIFFPNVTIAITEAE